MVDATTEEYVAPRWKTRCGYEPLPPDAGKSVVGFADSGLQANGGYLSCPHLPLYGPNRAPWLEGPACARTEETVTLRGCDPLK